MTPENCNYVRYCVSHPGLWAKLLSGVARSLVRRVLGPGRSAATAAPCLYRDETTSPAAMLDRLPTVQRPPGLVTALDRPIERLGLSESVTATSFFDQPSGPDLERYFFVHRHHWLLQCLARGCTNEDLGRLVGLVTAWIERFTPRTAPLAWETYSTAERTVHWLIFLAAIHRERPPDEQTLATLHRALEAHSHHVLQHLELRGARTNNHILNDARALLWAGSTLYPTLDNQAFEVGSRLWEEHGPRLIGSDGWLKEGSTHYHLLLHRTVAELVWLLDHHGRPPPHALLLSLRDRMDTVSTGLFVDGGREFPAIGDTSPDVPRTWFHPSLETDDERRALGSRLSLRSDPRIRPADRVRLYDHLCLLRLHEWTLFLPLHPQGSPAPTEHGHNDIGSPVLFWSNVEVLIDVGRKSYEGDVDAQAERHSTLILDGFPPYPAYHSFRHDDYRQDPPRLSIEQQPERIVAKLTLFGFRRLAAGVIWERVFELTPGEVTIVDRIEGHGPVDLATRFYLPEVRVTQDRSSEWSFEAGEGAFVLSTRTLWPGKRPVPLTASIEPAVRSPDYGAVAPALCFVQKCPRASLPARLELKLRLAGG